MSCITNVKSKTLISVFFAFFEMMCKSEPTELNRWYKHLNTVINDTYSVIYGKILLSLDIVMTIFTTRYSSIPV